MTGPARRASAEIPVRRGPPPQHDTAHSPDNGALLWTHAEEILTSLTHVRVTGGPHPVTLRRHSV